MHVEFLIIGQGISGTWLSYFLEKEKRSYVIIDNNDRFASSRLAAGVINPVTGRRHVEVWMADEIIPFAKSAYADLGTMLGIEAISQKTLIDFFPSAQMRESFMHRLDEKNKYAFEVTHIEAYRSYFTFDFGAGEIRPVFIVNLEQILPAWKKYLLSKQLLHDENFETNELKVSDDKVSYKNLTADRIIFSNGHHAAEQSWFNRLPFAPNKGEIIIAEIPGLPADHIYKKGMVMVPLSTKDHWWIGSDYKWEFEDAQPTKEFRDRIESLLRNWLKLPFKVIDHFAGIRPATLERRPFVGMHPVYKNLGIFNGMGTKGCSLAPFFAKEYVDHLTNNKQITPDADVNRFKNILSR